MALVESLIAALSVGVAKYLAKELLPHDLLDQISEELVDLAARRLTGREPYNPVEAAIGKRIQAVYDHSKLVENEKTAVLLECIHTLAAARIKTADDIVQADLDAGRLRQMLLRTRPQATDLLSQDGEALYNQMLRVACESMVDTADQMTGYIQAVDRVMLRNQRTLVETQAQTLLSQEKLTRGFARWLAEPEEKAKRFQERYCRALVERLDKMEPFGIRQPDEIGEKLRLQVAFIKLNLTMPRLTPHSSLSGRRETLADAPPELAAKEKWEESAQSPMTQTVVPLEQALAEQRRIMIEGPAGSGKSTLLQWIAVQAAQNSFPETMQAWNQLVPFFIRLRRCRQDGFPPPEAWPRLEANAVAGRMPPEWAHELLESGRALVLIDGVDEMPLKQRNGFLREIRALVKQYPLARYAVTSRPSAVNEKQWPEWRDWLRDAHFIEAAMREMEGEQLEIFVAQWHNALRESVAQEEEKAQASQNGDKLIQLLRKRLDLRQLAATPLLAAMICALYQDRQDNIPRERLKLYEECVEMLLERREQRKEVDLSQDYVNLSYPQKIALLRELAYWMLDNELSVASSEDAETVFNQTLPGLNLNNISGAQIRQLFVDRIGLLQEAIVDEVSFRHRSFQEYLAAQAAIYHGNIGVLLKHARNDQWRETIILAAGLAPAREKEKLLNGLIKKAEKLQTDANRRQLLLLALACLETCVELDPTVRWRIMDAAREVFPPHSREEALQIAQAGERAAALLYYHPDMPDEIAAHCLAALAAIGGDAALAAIASFKEVESHAAQRALVEAWDHFEVRTFAASVLAERQEFSFSKWPAHKNWSELLPQLTSLYLWSASVNDLTPLQGLPHLAKLNLSGTAANDLSPLQGLTQLVSLSLSGTVANDLSPLQGLTQLVSLSLSETALDDLMPLQGLHQLASLYLDGTAVNDLTPLQGLTQLVSLSLWDTTVNDLSPLQGLPQLTKLFLWNILVNSLTPLQGLTQLGSLYLSGTAVNDLTPLQGLTQLTSLSVWDVPVNNLTPLQGMTQLTELALIGMTANDLMPLQELLQLTELYLSGTAVNDLTPLHGLTQLTSLYLGGTAVNDLTPLQRLTQLVKLHLDGTVVNDLTPLQGLTQLAELDLSETGVNDLTPLQGLTQLAELDLSETGVNDLTPLQGLTQLAELDLSETPVNDLSLLQGLPRLTKLHLSDEQIRRFYPELAGMKRGRGLSIYNDSHKLYRYLPPNVAYD